MKPEYIDGMIPNMLWDITKWILAATCTSIAIKMREKLLTAASSAYTGLRTAIATAWNSYRPYVKSLTRRQVGISLAVILGCCTLFYGGQQVRLHYSEKARQEALAEAAEKAREAEKERVENEKAKQREANWQKFVIENSNHPSTRWILYHSRVWVPAIFFFAVIYAAYSRATVFIVLGKFILLLVFFLSIIMIVATTVPVLAEWQLFIRMREIVAQTAKLLDIPVVPTAWLGFSVVGGVILEALGRLGTPPSITVQPANVTVNVAKS